MRIVAERLIAIDEEVACDMCTAHATHVLRKPDSNTPLLIACRAHMHCVNDAVHKSNAPEAA